MRKFLLLSGALALAAFSSVVSVSAQEKTIGRVFFDLSHPYQQAADTQFQLDAKNRGYATVSLDGRSQSDTIDSAMSDLIARGVDGIIVQPADGKAIASAIQVSQDAGIPVVVFFNPVDGATAPFVRINEYNKAVELGRMAATKAKELWPGQPIKVGVIDQPGVEYVIDNRSNAFIVGVKEIDADAEVVARLDGNGTREQSFTVGNDLLQSHPEVNIVYGINDDSSLGALAAFEAAGRGLAEDGNPLTEIFVGTGGSEGEALKVKDPSSALKLTMALSPRLDSQALNDVMEGMFKGEIGIDEAFQKDTEDFIYDGWDPNAVQIVDDFLKNNFGVE